MADYRRDPAATRVPDRAAQWSLWPPQASTDSGPITPDCGLVDRRGHRLDRPAWAAGRRRA